MKKEKETRPIVINDDDSIPSGFGLGKDKFDELNKKPFSFITKAFKFI